MSMDREENTETLAELAAGSGPGPAPRASEVDRKLDIIGNVDTGASDEISLSDKVDGSEKGFGGQGVGEERGPGDFVKRMNGEGNVAEGTENETDDGGKEADNSREGTGSEKDVYAVGDFVWGKIKSHPWWPGRVYESSAASDFAMKYNQSGRLLVAYFGDGSFSWCPPSQLVPFVDNFERMSKQSTAKNFLNAVEKALDEFCILVEFDITRQLSEESRAGLSWPVTENAGIKKGVRVPEGETVRLLLSQYDPAGILKGLQQHAQTSSNSNTLKFAVLRSWLSAFYRAKCGRPLPLYCEPLPVEGLEDKKTDQAVDANDFSVPIEVPIQGPPKEETPNSVPADKIYKRKQKSVAELIGNDVKAKYKKATGEDSTPSPVETSEKKRRKSGEQAEGHTSSSKGVDGKVGKKLSISIPEHDENAGPLSRERKKSKYLSPPYTSPKWSTAGKAGLKKEAEIESQKVSEITRIGERMTKAARLILSSPVAENGNGTVNEKKAKKFDTAEKSSRTGKCSSMIIDTMDISSPVNEVLSEVQSTALNPRNGSLEKTRGFISTFRNAVYSDGTNYKHYQKMKTGKRRKSPESGNAKKRKINHVEAEDDGAGTETSPVILMVTFATGFSLPPEDDIFQIYEKFGILNKKETKLLYEVNAVQIVYMRDADAEVAFKESVKQSPFGEAKVNYKLSYPSSDTLKTSGSGKESSARENSEVPLSSLKVDKGKSQVQVIKQKLKGLEGCLVKCNGKITSEEKSELEGEIKGLLEKVSTVQSKNP